MRKFVPSHTIIVANQAIKVDAPVVTWRESGWDAKSPFCIPTETEPNARSKCISVAGGQAPYDGFSKTAIQRYSLRPQLRRYGDNPPLEAVKAVVKQFVVHHDGCANSDMCFNVLHNERGLSCHFLIDNDGTIHQTLDLAYAAWHASEWNVSSIGVELANRGDANEFPDFYSSGKANRGPQRDKKPCKINGHKILAYDYTPAQYANFGLLVRALQRVLPNIPLEYPQSSPGVQSWETLPQSASHGFAGYITHYHLTNQKWDPGPFDFKDFLSKLRGKYSMPIFWYASKPDEYAPYVPEQREDLEKASKKLNEMNELDADGGFFPVGPWGEHRLWHGGIHLAAKPKSSVHAPFPGRIVAARMGPDQPIGSTNFVLLRHDLALGELKVQFFSLYMHLADLTKAEDRPEWMKSEGWTKGYKPGEVVLLDEPVDAAKRIGQVGVAGPNDLSKSQLHVSFFSSGDLFSTLPNTPWEVIDGTAGGRFCDAPRINDLIDSNRNAKLERSELKSFYESGGGGQTRNFVTFHISEWTFEPSWSESLRVPADFKDMTKQDIDALVAEQIAPGLWWDQRVAQHAKLPLDGIVYHYNPIAFVSWFNMQMIEAAMTDQKTKVVLDAKDTSKVPPGITDDREGMGMRSEINIEDDPCNKSLTLDQLVLGYDSAECAPQ